MEDVKTPMEEAAEQPWLRVVTGLLQFVGGGLVALHEQESVPKAREPEPAGERDIRQRMEGLGIRTDLSDVLRNAWTSAAPPGPPPSPQATPIPTLSFEEFAAAAASHLGVAQTPSPPPPQPEPSQPAPSDSAEERRKFNPYAGLMEIRVDALEAKCRDIRLLFAALAPGCLDDQVSDAAREPAAISDVPEVSEDREASVSTVEVTTAADDAPHAKPESNSEPKTVVQGPWAAARPDDGGGAGGSPHGEPSSVYDTHERRVAALERTFESFGRMVEGLTSRPRGKGPPIE